MDWIENHAPVHLISHRINKLTSESQGMKQNK